MKIKINHKKITSFPIIDEELLMDEDITQIENSIIYGNNSSVLVSGYRGAGKTSVINNLKYRITEVLAKDNENQNEYVFIHLDLNKNIEYKMILRQLIRKLYISLNEQLKSHDNLDIINEIEVIYNKTFYDISHSINYKKLWHNSILSDSKIDLKKILLAFGGFIFSISNINIDKLNLSNSIMILISAFSLSYLSSQISIINKLETSDTEELNSKSLYDDDIAQYELENILKNLNKANIKCIFILDELDKIEDSGEVDKILYELKPLILSNLATFIIVCGQKLHYRYIESETRDDPVISSLFTSTLHIPLATRSQLQDIFESYIERDEDNNELGNEIISNHVDLLIFKSNGVLRKFNNEIYKNIVWEGKDAYLYIDIDSLSSEVEVKIVSIIEDIANSSNDVVNVIKDFFVQQLYIWSKKIRYKIKFTIDDILDLEEYKSKPYLEPYIEEISIWFNRLLSYMEDGCILEKIDTDGEISYKLNFNLNTSEEDNKLSNKENILINDNLVYRFISLIDQVVYYGTILCELMNINIHNRFNDMLIYLEENKVIVRESFISYNLEDINNLYESITNNTLEEMTDKDRLLIKESTHYIKTIRSYIIESMFLYHTKNIIENKYYDSVVEKKVNIRTLGYCINNKDQNIFLKILYNEDGSNKVLSLADRNNKTAKYDKIVNIVIDENTISYNKYLYNSDVTESGRVLSYKGKNNKEKEYKKGVYLYYLPILNKEDDIKSLLEYKYPVILDEVLNSNMQSIEAALTI